MPPSLLLSLDKKVLTKSFKEPHIEVFDEEEDVELDKLVVEELDHQKEKEDTYKKI